MKIESIGTSGRLFTVADLLSEQDSELLQTLDWASLPWIRQSGQESWSRRLITDEAAAPYAELINNAIPKISENIRAELKAPYTRFWIDEPGFTVSIHTDGHLKASVQMFWLMPTDQHGTKFFNSKIPTDYLWDSVAKPNTGYVMLNKLNDDGSQPLHWHGMLNPVPPNCLRVTSYTVFSDYEIK